MSEVLSRPPNADAALRPCSDCRVLLAKGEGWTSADGRRACDPCSTACDECGRRTDAAAPNRCKCRLFYGARAKKEEARIDEMERVEALNGLPDPETLNFFSRLK